MKLQRVQIQNFRSIVDSGAVSIEERLTVLIGKNEQGKSNFLKALASFNSENRYIPNDLPNHLRPTLEGKDQTSIPIVTLWLSPNGSDRKELKELVPTIDTIQEFKVTKYFDGSYEYWYVDGNGRENVLEVPPPNIEPFVDAMLEYAEALKGRLTAHAGRLPAFAPSVAQAGGHIDQFAKANFSDHAQIDNLVKTFATSLRGLPGQDQAIQDDIATTIKEIQTKHAEIQQTLSKTSLSVFEQRLPYFLFHSSVLDKIPNEVNVPVFIADPEKTSRGMANLCGAAGLSTQKIQELASSTDTSAREAYEDHYRSSISGGINEFWTQETYNVHFRIEKEKLSVSISDNTYSPRIPPSERSDGFQWYLSFYCALLNEVSATDPTVILLDNPALELHSDGQQDIKRFLEERMPSASQIIYVTHSPAMIDPYNLEQVRKVELQGHMQGTKVVELTLKGDSGFDLLEPVRSAIGARLVSSLVFNDFNVLVEGAADKPLLEGAFACLDEKVARKVLINGSVSESKDGFLPRLYQRAGLPFVILVDADSSGRDLSASLKRWGIPQEKIVELGKVFSSEEIGLEKSKDFELEDTISQDSYHKAVSETYPAMKLDPPKVMTGKRTNYYEKSFKDTYGTGFGKRRVGETVKKMLLERKVDSKTVERLKKLAGAIWNTLEAQTSVRKESGDRKVVLKIPESTGDLNSNLQA